MSQTSSDISHRLKAPRPIVLTLDALDARRTRAEKALGMIGQYKQRIQIAQLARQMFGVGRLRKRNSGEARP